MTFEGIYAGDYGYDLTVICKNIRTKAVMDVSSYTTLEFDIYDPDGNKATDGTDGSIDYTVEDGDIDEAGVWTLIGRLISATQRYTSRPIEFTVT